MNTDHVATLNKLHDLSNHSSLMIGVAFDCAMDNAGFGGWHRENLSPEQAAEVLRHASSIFDAGMLDGMTEEDRTEGLCICNR